MLRRMRGAMPTRFNDWWQSLTQQAGQPGGGASPEYCFVQHWLMAFMRMSVLGWEFPEYQVNARKRGCDELLYRTYYTTMIDSPLRSMVLFLCAVISISTIPVHYDFV